MKSNFFLKVRVELKKNSKRLLLGLGYHGIERSIPFNDHGHNYDLSVNHTCNLHTNYFAASFFPKFKFMPQNQPIIRAICLKAQNHDLHNGFKLCYIGLKAT